MNYQDRLALSFRALLFFSIIQLTVPCNAQQSMRANLKAINPGGAPVLIDGNLTNYASIYSNDVDMDDAWKMSNFGENFGLLRNGYTLVVERRKVITTADTTFFRMWNMRARSYQLEFILKDFDQPRLSAFLYDKYSGVRTAIALDDTTTVHFDVDTNPASYDEQRFMLIYAEPAIHTASLPLSIVDFKTYRNEDGIAVEWKVINEISVEKYIVEHSLDGRNFKQIREIPAKNTGTESYNLLDITAVPSDNFYRILAVRITGNIEYSTISKVDGTHKEMSVYPNPVAGRFFQLKLGNSAPGTYKVKLVNTNGITYPLKSFSVITGQRSQSMDLPAYLPAGVYRLTITSASNGTNVVTVQLQ